MANYAAYGTLLKVGDAASPEVFTTVAGVVEIGGPSLEMEPIEVTNHSSANAWREYIGGLLNGGEVSLINYDPAHATLDAGTGPIKDMTDRTLRNWQLVFSDSGTTTWTISAFVTGFEPGAPVDDKLSAAVTLTLSGEPTLA